MGPAETLRPAWPSDQPCVRTQIILANSRLIACRQDGVTFRNKDYRADGRARYKQMTLATDEFIRRFLIHVLPKGFHRIRHYGLFATPSCTDNIARARELLAVPMPQDHNADADAVNPNEPATPSHPCPCCGGRMITIEIFARAMRRPIIETNPQLRHSTIISTSKPSCCCPPAA
jgi:hypothetical protein